MNINDFVLDILNGGSSIGWQKEFSFDITRKWRFDYANPIQKIAIEVEGGAWTNGRHTRGAGFIKDIEKYNAATRQGWRIFRYTPEQMLTHCYMDDTEELICLKTA